MKTFIVSLSLLALAGGPLWGETVDVDWHGRALALEIPAGMCDFSDSRPGGMLLDYLSKGNAVDPALPDPYAVFMDCDNLENLRDGGELGYPWGYIGLPKRPDPLTASVTQQQVNGMLESLAETDAMQSYLDTVNSDVADVRENWMPGLEVQDLRGFASVLANDAVFVGYMRANGVVDGKAFKEHILFSTTVLDGIFVNYYIYENEAGMAALPEHVKQMEAVARANLQSAL